MDSQNMENLIKVSDKDNLLYILYNEILFFFNGEKWKQFQITTTNLPDSNFGLLKKPTLVEIPPQKDSLVTLLVTGGLIPECKTFAKTNYLLNIKKYQSEGKNVCTYDCLLDFKYGDIKCGRFLHCAVNINNQYVIIIGGKNEKEWLSSCEYLDLKTGEWKEFPSMNCARSNFDCTVLYSEYNHTIKIYAYGGYCNVGKFSDCLMECYEVDLNNPTKSKWTKVSLSNGDLNLPKICSRIVAYEENLLVIGGSDGSHLTDTIYDIDPNSGEVKDAGRLYTPRNNFHVLYEDFNIYAIGGSVKQYILNKDDILENYIEKFSFDLNNNIEKEKVEVLKDSLIAPIQNLGIDTLEFLNEPGFPYAASVIGKKFNN